MTEPLQLVALETSPPAFSLETAARLAREIFGVKARRSRVLIGTEEPEGNVLKIHPPLPLSPEHVPIFLAALRASLP